jgi:hypothetical protein
MLRFDKNKINFREEEFGGLVINKETGKLFKMNKTGYSVFVALYGGGGVIGVIEEMQRKFPKQKEEVERDIVEFIDCLVGMGLASQRGRKT